MGNPMGLEATFERLQAQHQLTGHCECCSHRIASDMRAALLEIGQNIPAEQLLMVWNVAINNLIQAMKAKPELDWVGALHYSMQGELDERDK